MFSNEKLIELLQSKGWSNYRLAKESGLGNSTINEIVSGKKKTPNADTLYKIASALGVPIDILFTESTLKDEIQLIIPKLSNLEDDKRKLIIDMIKALDK